MRVLVQFLQLELEVLWGKAPDVAGVLPVAHGGLGVGVLFVDIRQAQGPRPVGNSLRNGPGLRLQLHRLLEVLRGRDLQNVFRDLDDVLKIIVVAQHSVNDVVNLAHFILDQGPIPKVVWVGEGPRLRPQAVADKVLQIPVQSTQNEPSFMCVTHGILFAAVVLQI
jgi:hypothetical protein